MVTPNAACLQKQSLFKINPNYAIDICYKNHYSLFTVVSNKYLRLK